MRTIEEILKDEHELACKQAILHKIASSFMQQNVLNGYKRKYRCISREYYDIALRIMSKSYDYYDIKIPEMSDTVRYSPTTVISHFDKWHDIAKADLKTLADLNKDFFDLTGCFMPKFKTLNKCLCKQIEKTKRILNKYRAIGTGPSFLVELYNIDRHLHEKYKKKECEHA